MTLFRNAAIALAATATMAAPVAATAAAAPAFDGARATSGNGGQSDLEGSSSWIIGLIGLLAGVTAAILIASNDDDEPVSP